MPGRTRIEVVEADLTREETDAIVNAANGRLAHGGGVAAIISRAAGPELQADCDRLVRERGPFETGSAVASTAGRLPFKGVIHAIGPRQGQGEEERKLVSALLASFLCAEESGWRSLAFPAVSAGIFAVPLEVCSRAYFGAADRWFRDHPLAQLRRLRLCLRDQPVIDAVLAEAARWKSV